MNSSVDNSDFTPPPLTPPRPPVPTPRPPKSPGLALLLSVFPGIGQIYNGQIAKAFVFFFGFVGSIWLAADVSVFPFLLVMFFVYFFNLVDAYRSASLVNTRAEYGRERVEEEATESPAWGLTLMILGFILLAHNLEWLNLRALQRFWPVLLVGGGFYLMFKAVQRRQRSQSGGDGDV